MMQSLPNTYGAVPQAPAPFIPGTTRLVLRGAGREFIQEVFIPPGASKLAPDTRILPLLRERFQAAAPRDIVMERVRFVIGRDNLDVRREEGDITEGDTIDMRELEDGDEIQVLYDPSPAVKARMLAASQAITPQTLMKAAAAAVAKAAAEAAASHEGPLPPTTPKTPLERPRTPKELLEQ